MKIEKDKVVAIEYSLKDEAGNVIDSSANSGSPLEYLHGHGNLISGLETILEGKNPGEKFSAVVPPAEGYGEVNPQLIVEVPRSQFDMDDGEIKVGMQFYAQSNAGPVMVRVSKISGDKITIDGNHFLAGKTLYFDVEVKSVSDASAEQIKAGTVYSGGCGGGCSCGSGCGGNCGDGGNCAGGCGGGCGNCGS